MTKNEFNDPKKTRKYNLHYNDVRGDVLHKNSKTSVQWLGQLSSTLTNLQRGCLSADIYKLYNNGL